MAFKDVIVAVGDTLQDWTDRRDDPPRVYWRNGAKQTGTGGFFYVKADDLAMPASAPWREAELYQNEPAFVTDTADVIVVGTRTQAFIPVRQDGREVSRRWLTKWEPNVGATVYTEALLLSTSGLEDSPVVWAMRGLTGAAFAKAMKTYRNGLLKYAERQAGRRLPLWSFRLRFTTERDVRGRVLFVPTGFGSLVTPPALQIPDQVDDALVEQLFVGPDELLRGQEWREQYDAWLRERRGNQDEDQAEAETVGITGGDAKSTNAAAFAALAGRGHVKVDAASAEELGVEIPY